MRRIIYAGTGAVLAACFVSNVMAQDTYPGKPIRLVVPYAPGAITDLAARLLAEHLSARLGQPIIVENKSGGGARIGALAVANAQSDGYTLLFANSVTHGTVPAMSRALPFDPVKSFAPVGRAFVYSSTLVCNQAIPPNSISELIRYTTEHPDKLTNATAGPGTGHDLLGGLYNSVTGGRMLHVHYRGAAPALQDVLGGTADCIWGGGDVKQYVQNGKLKAFATSGERRDPDFPDVPTMAEAGVKDFKIVWWQGVAAPAGTPPAVIVRLNQAINQAVDTPALKDRARVLSLVPAGGTPEDMARVIQEDLARYSAIVESAHIPFQD